MASIKLQVSKEELTNKADVHNPAEMALARHYAGLATQRHINFVRGLARKMMHCELTVSHSTCNLHRFSVHSIDLTLIAYLGNGSKL